MATTQRISRYYLLARRAKILRDYQHIGEDQRYSDNRLT